MRTSRADSERRRGLSGRAIGALSIALLALMPTAAFAAWQGSFTGRTQASTAVLGAPVGFTAHSASATSISLTWTAPAGVAPTGFTIVRTSGGGSVGAGCSGLAAVATSCTESGLTTGTSYTWTIQSKAGARWVSGTASASATPTATSTLTIAAASGAGHRNVISGTSTVATTGTSKVTVSIYSGSTATGQPVSTYTTQAFAGAASSWSITTGNQDLNAGSTYTAQATQTSPSSANSPTVTFTAD